MDIHFLKLLTHWLAISVFFPRETHIWKGSARSPRWGLLVLLKGVNHRFWSQSRCSGRNVLILKIQSVFDGTLEETIKNPHHTYKSLAYDLANHESPIAQWLERPTVIWKVMGSTPVGGLCRKFFFWIFRLENASSLFTLYPSHQSIYDKKNRCHFCFTWYLLGVK